MCDVDFETFYYLRSQRLKILYRYSLISHVLSEISRIIVVSSIEYISLCKKAYKYVELLHLCVKHGKKDTNEHIVNKARKRTHQKNCERRRKTIQQTNSIHDEFLHRKK